MGTVYVFDVCIPSHSMDHKSAWNKLIALNAVVQGFERRFCLSVIFWQCLTLKCIWSVKWFRMPEC